VLLLVQQLSSCLLAWEFRLGQQWQAAVGVQRRILLWLCRAVQQLCMLVQTSAQRLLRMLLHSLLPSA
jgi:hypothetical protein